MQKLLSLARKAINDYHMIQDGDKIAVGISGGKDSIALLTILANYRKFAPEKFDLVGININVGFEGVDQEEVANCKRYCEEELEVPLIIENTNIKQIYPHECILAPKAFEVNIFFKIIKRLN